MKKEIQFKNEVLIRLRRENEWSQQDLASLIDVSRQTISKWESGEKTPDLHNVNKLCKQFKVEINELVDGIYETQTKYKNKSFGKISITKKVILSIIILYFITIVSKAILFSYILYKNDMKKMTSFGYAYNEENCLEDKEKNEKSFLSRSSIVYYKDNVEHKLMSFGQTDVYMVDEESWMFENEREYYAYTKGKNLSDNIEQEDFTYQTGALYRDYTPFEMVASYRYKLGIWQILNPLKYYQINDEGEMIIPLEEENSKLYINIKTGYLDKIKYSVNSLRVKTLTEIQYIGHQVNDIEDSQVELTEEMKYKIIENSRGD